MSDAGLMDTAWIEGLVRLEIQNRSLIGYDMSAIEAAVEAGKGDVTALWEAYEAALRTELPADYRYEEPNDLASIRALRPDGPRKLAADPTNAQLRERIRGALTGRVAGVTLGRPVEGWTEEGIRKRLESVGEYPLKDYFGRYWYEDGERKDTYWASFRSTREGLAFSRGAEGDDDLNYTVMGLRILEKYGPNFRTLDVGYQWLESMPVNWTYGPERTAYINLARFTEFHDRWGDYDFDTLWKVTHYLHESSELIGAQIRADAFGYVAACLPELAAEWGWRDGVLTHVRNGIYGEMLWAAIIAAAFGAPSIRDAIEIGLTEIPENCRLAEATRNTLKWWDETADWRAVYERIAEAYNKYTPGGTINNSCFQVNGLLAGEGDFEKTLCITVMQGQDTDCTAGTVGSVIGAWLGAGGIPEKWTRPLNDTFRTAIVGDGHCSITAIADRLASLANSIGKAYRTLPFKYDR